MYVFYFPELFNFVSASFEMTCPHISLIGGLESVVCCLKIGHEKTE